MGSKTTSKVILLIDAIPNEKISDIYIEQKIFNELTVQYNPFTMGGLPIDIVVVQIE